ncbi:MAG TPA: pyruvate kinase [Aggregatilineales bacterium]|nr:pyruvate kinase [Aggregatilineales bacterium]
MVRKFDTKRTKIVCTIGPASSDEVIIREMIRAGMDVARINFSHGDYQTHGANIALIRRVAVEEGAIVAILGDLQGPKIRLGKIANEPISLEKGDHLTLTTREADGSNMIFPLPHPEFVKDVKAGHRLLLDDGQLEFKVIGKQNNGDLVCEVVIGGPLSSRKGISAPESKLTLSAITDKDREDVKFALEQKVDYIAMSFVRSGNDMRELRWLCRHLEGDVALISKIEKREAIENIDDIIEASDGVMVARGDLGVETPAEAVPIHQKEIIRRCNAVGKPVITATQMLNSMIFSPRPTRAEASDVANAIFDGTDAVMLSGETASGKYPVIAVETMATIAMIAETHLKEDARAGLGRTQLSFKGMELVSDATSAAASQIAEELGAKLIVTATWTGYTSRQVARTRPVTPILCVTPNEETYRRMAMVWGVLPIMVPEFSSVDEMLEKIVQTAYDARLVEYGDLLVIIAGLPFGAGGHTNFLKIHTVGEGGEVTERAVAEQPVNAE